jgi:hypothetical protein
MKRTSPFSPESNTRPGSETETLAVFVKSTCSKHYTELSRSPVAGMNNYLLNAYFT